MTDYQPLEDYSTIRILSLDIWNTLIISNPQFKIEQLNLFANYLEIANDEKLIARLKHIDQMADRLCVNTGKDLGFEWRMEKLGKKYNKLAFANFAKLIELYQQMEEIFIVNLPFLIEPDLADTLTKIKEKGVKICFLSNTGFIKGKTMRKILQQLGIYEKTDFCIFSDEVGYSKPNPLIFKLLMKEMNCLPQEVLHIGDNYKADYWGAKKVHFHSLVFEKAEKKSDKIDTFATDKSIHQISSLLYFL